METWVCLLETRERTVSLEAAITCSIVNEGLNVLTRPGHVQCNSLTHEFKREMPSQEVERVLANKSLNQIASPNFQHSLCLVPLEHAWMIRQAKRLWTWRQELRSNYQADTEAAITCSIGLKGSQRHEGLAHVKTRAAIQLPGRYRRLDLFIQVLRHMCPNLTDASLDNRVTPSKMFEDACSFARLKPSWATLHLISYLPFPSWSHAGSRG